MPIEYCFVSFHLLSSVWYCCSENHQRLCGVKTPQVTSYRFGKITKEYANVLGKITHASPLLFGRVWHKMKRHERKKKSIMLSTSMLHEKTNLFMFSIQTGELLSIHLFNITSEALSLWQIWWMIRTSLTSKYCWNLKQKKEMLTNVFFLLWKHFWTKIQENCNFHLTISHERAIVSISISIVSIKTECFP